MMSKIKHNIWILLGIVAVVIAIIYIFIYPLRDQPAVLEALPWWKFVVIRWFHALVWILLAIASFIQHWARPRGTPLAKNVARLALVCYIAFFVVNATL